MNTEYEAKFSPVNKNKIRQKLRSLKADLVTPERKMRRVIFGSELNPQINADYLRVRDEGDKVRVSLKVHAREGGKLSEQKETDVIVSDFEQTVKIFKSIGLKQDKYEENLRETWDLDGATVEIDTWPGLEPHIEIEAPSEKEVRRIAEELGFNWENKIITSVVEIYAKVYSVTNEEVLKRLTHCTFESPPF